MVSGDFSAIVAWSRWSEYTGSSAVCGMGRSIRFRTCNQDKPVNGGVCVGSSIQRRFQKGNCTGDLFSFYALTVEDSKL